MSLDARADKIRRSLNRMYPKARPPLSYNTPFQLLVATLLSAQSTDSQVNQVTAELFKHLQAPADFASAGLETIEGLIRSTGLHRRKAKNIRQCARSLIRHHHGRVPSSLKELVALPGVGRKTANVVLSTAFGVPAVVVDTHVARVAHRLGLTSHRAPPKIEIDLEKRIPRPHWRGFCLRLIYFGRETCTARRPKCPHCPLGSLCHWPQKADFS